MDRPDMIARLKRVLANERRVAEHVGPVGAPVRREAQESIEALEAAIVALGVPDDIPRPVPGIPPWPR